MINRKHAVINDPQTGMKLFIHPGTLLIFAAKGEDLECYIPGGLLPYYEQHLVVLMDVVIETAYNFNQFTIHPTCPAQVGKLMDMINTGTSLAAPSIKVSREFFNAAYGIKEDGNV